ncbi:S8 family serine peptidase [Tenacibaculum sp. M341]|uniref:S8 family serine peptidase n=1 Tax=Tenacibaculum sp. M341 TaxID=2530339 RepID=UPI001045B40A|nr:S8 family serine peptidase [Tenacibaculum sp. M341]TCI92160.1 T9SS type A sorting domain-containing protein [Tenacibaculum sp. M341]
MRNYYVGKFLFSAAVLASCIQGHAQSKKQADQIRKNYNLTKLEGLKKTFVEKAATEKQKAVQLAKQNGWKTKLTTEDNRVLELQRVVNGKPIYYSTFNVDAARSTRTNHLNSGGSLGLNLMGQGMTAHVWDGGIARASHQEYDGAGGTNRFSVGDGSSSLNFHAAHVTGTIIASGVQADAKGMAPHADAVGYDWNNDQAEATTAASNGMLVSNHSYGFAARNPNTGQVQLPQYFFGGYIDESRAWDEILFNAPNYLMVVAAGNDGNDNTANTNPTGGNGFDKLTGHSTSKNNLVVANAQDANVDSNGNLISVAINSSSSEGPTDDFRIKPDITGNGTGVYSTYETSNTAYNTITGTSMASPNVAGSLLILQQHHNNVNGSFMRAATLKGLALHTADDAGVSGPDAVFGWGLLNAKKAAETITNESTGATRIEELTLNSGQTYSITVESDGTSPLLASISWTDRPGVATTTVNSTTPVLVNDLDIRVTKSGTTYLPYELTGATTNTRRDNNVDPYERIDVTGASGTYTITVTNKGTLTGGSQNYSLIVTGLKGSGTTNPTPDTCENLPYSQGFESNAGWTQVSGDDGDWVRDSGATPSSNTGPSSATEGNFYMFLEASSNGSTGQIGANGTAILESPCFDLSGVSNATFSFSNHMYGSNVGSLQVQVSSNNGASWSNVWSESGNQGNQWNDVSVNLNSFAGSNIKIRLVGTTGNGWSSDIAVDNLAVTAGGGSTADTQAPSVPSNVQASSITETTATISWSASSDNVGVTGYDVYQGSSNIGTVTATSANITGLSAGTSYTFSVVAVDAAGNESSAGSVSFTTTSNTPAPVNYCTSRGNRSSFEWIDKVQLGGISNVTGDNGGYGDFTSQVGSLVRGSSANSMVVSAGFSGTAYTEFWSVWIDFNQNGTFEASEQVVSGSSSSAGDLSASVDVPSSALLGQTRMRVSMKYNSAQTACETFDDGEVEDYTINIIATGTSSFTTFATTSDAKTLGNEEPLKITTFPNPASSFVQVKMINKGNADSTYRIINTIGQTVQNGQLSAEQIDISNLNSGIYVLEVNDGQKEHKSKLVKK